MHLKNVAFPLAQPVDRLTMLAGLPQTLLAGNVSSWQQIVRDCIVCD